MPFSPASTDSAQTGARTGRPVSGWGRGLGTLLLATALATGTVAVSGQGAQAAGVRSATHDSYARLVFDMDAAVPFTAQIVGNQLVVQFDQPFAGSIDGAAVRRLDGYIGNGVLSADRKTATFDLKKPIGLRAFPNERSAVIDLLNTPNQAAQAPAAPQVPVAQATAPQAAGTPQAIAPVAATAAASTVAPTAPAAPAVAMQNAAPEPSPGATAPLTPVPMAPAVVNPVPARPAAAPAPQTAPAPAAARPATPPAPVAQAVPAAARPAAAPTQPPVNVPVRIGVHDDYTRLVFDWDKNIDYAVSRDGGLVRVRFAKAANFDLAALRRSLPKSIASVDTAMDGDATTVTLALRPDAKTRDGRSGPKVVFDVLGSPDAVAPPAPAPGAPPATTMAAAAPATTPATTPAQTPALMQAPTTPPPQAAAVQAPPPAPVAPLPPTTLIAPALSKAAPPAAVKPAVIENVVVGAATLQGVPTLKFPMKPAPAAAVFTRGGQLYVVFDRPAKLDLANVRKLERTFPKSEQLMTDQGGELLAFEGTVFRFTPPANTVPQIGKDADGWTVAVRPQAQKRPEVPVRITPEAQTESGPLVVIGLDGASAQAVAIPDPELGDVLQVIPTGQPGRGVEGDRQFAQFSLLASYQGLVVSPKADNLDLRIAANQVSIGTQAGLLLSRGSGPTTGARIYDFARWQQGDVDYTETRQLLQRAVADADDASRPAARFELAQFYLARNQAADAIGMLDLIAAGNPALGRDPALKALRGAARVMLDDGATALTDLSDARLDGMPEALLWRAAAATQTRDWASANDAFRRAGPVPATYSPQMRYRLALAQAEAAINMRDFARAKAPLDSLARADVPSAIRARGDYLRARAYMDSGDNRSASPIIERLQTSSDPWTKSRAQVLSISQRVADGSMKPAQAIDELERIRFAWNGDQLEYQLLVKLGELYQQTGDYRNGLERWRDAINYFPKQAETDGMKARMTDAFVNLYVDPDKANVPPLTALAIYDDYRDLTPPGERGDVMIQKLADRLVAVDLLDRAAELLDHQMRNRLTGADKARVGARLAVVDLLDRKPDAAIVALDASELAALPPDLASERRQLRARALLESGDAPQAIAALDGDASREADRLRAQIYSRSQDWTKASDVLGKLVGSPKDKPLDQARQRTVLNYAIALILANKMDDLRRLHDDFGPLLTDAQSREAFNVLTSGNYGGSKGTDSVALSTRFAELSEMQSAMENYRNKLKTSGLSTIN